MRLNYQFALILSFILLATASCKKDDPVPSEPSTSPNKIMALGASRVEGDSPNYESFRYELWKDLIDGGYTFDFIGTMTDPGNYANHSNLTFDPHHEGYGGYTSGEILTELNNALNTGDVPDIVLFSSPGGNDALNGSSYSQAVSNVNAIIDALQAKNPNVTIIIEKMAPGHSSIMTAQLSTFMNDMNQEIDNITTQQSTSASQVISVDIHTGFQDSFLADDVHYNQTGAIFVADRYYAVLLNVLQ